MPNVSRCTIRRIAILSLCRQLFINQIILFVAAAVIHLIISVGLSPFLGPNPPSERDVVIRYDTEVVLDVGKTAIDIGPDFRFLGLEPTHRQRGDGFG